MAKYNDIQYLIDRPEPSDVFLKAISISGSQLQNQFNSFNKSTVNSSCEGFKWIKAELTYPSFDNLTFAYKNAVFSVVIELIDDSGTSFTYEQRKRLIDACDSNNLVPCIFKIKIIENETNNSSNLQRDKYEINNIKLMPLENGWNLFNAKTNERIVPESVANDKPKEMSEWELQNFAIQIVRSELEKDGNKVLSFCDLLEVNPQIWFKDKYGFKNWVVVKHIVNEEDLNFREWIGLEKNNPQLLPYDVFFASVQFFSNNNGSYEILNRGDAISINYKGLENIYIV